MELAGNLTAKLIEMLFDVPVEKKVVANLQVQNADLFRRKGAKELIRVLNDLRKKYGDLKLNVTGGFKSVVPLLTLYGQFFHYPVVYLYEQSESVIELPNVPFKLDFEQIRKAKNLLMALREGEVLTEKEWESKCEEIGLSMEQRNVLDAFVEYYDGMVSGSAILEMLQEDAERHYANVFLSEDAAKDLAQSSGSSHDQFVIMLRRVGEAWYRDEKHHGVFRGLTVIKPGNTSERMLYILDGNRVLVCRLLLHSEYEKFLNKSKQSAEDFLKQRFEPFIEKPEWASIPQTEEEYLDRIIQERDRLREEIELMLLDNEKSAVKLADSLKTDTLRDEEAEHLLKELERLERERAASLERIRALEHSLDAEKKTAAAVNHIIQTNERHQRILLNWIETLRSDLNDWIAVGKTVEAEKSQLEEQLSALRHQISGSSFKARLGRWLLGL
jgi:hypothetical protein